MDRQQEISLKSTGMLDLLNAWNKDAMAGAGAASLDQKVNWGRGGWVCALSWNSLGP